MSNRLLIIIATLLAALVLGLSLFWHPEPPELPLPIINTPSGGDFTLQSADGPVSLKDFRGKLVLLYFGYTYCPDICPTSLVMTSEGLQQLKPEELEKVAMIFISVDPERDTPEHLKEYAQFFHPKIIGVTGDPEKIAEIARQYGVFYAKQQVETAGDGYVVDHTADTYMIGQDGRLLGKIAHATPPEQVSEKIRLYLNYAEKGVSP